MYDVAPAHRRSPGIGRRILVVDDELLVSQKVCSLLETSGYTATYVLSGDECLKLLDRDSDFSLVVMDIDLGRAGPDGGAVAREVQRRHNLPIVFYTGHNDRKTIELTRDSASFGIVAKGPNDTEIMLASIENALRRWEIEQSALATSAFYRTIFQSLPAPLCVVETGSGAIRFANSAFERAFGSGEGRAFGEVVTEPPPDSPASVVDPSALGRLAREGEWRLMGPVSDSGGERCWLVGSREVSDTETVTVLADVSPLCALVAELDTETDRLNVLLHEVNHRVKNNLTVVDSLIGMAEQRSSGHADDFHELHNRVRAIRSLHEHLHGSSRQIGIDLPTYLTITLEELFPHACSERIDSSVESPHVEVDSRQALPVALIVVELATNACKHAFSAVEENWFRVRIRRVTNDELEVVVCHNGSRLPSDEAIGASGRSGLQLVRGLVRQLSGSLTIEREPHTRFVIRFPSQHASPSSN